MLKKPTRGGAKQGSRRFYTGRTTTTSIEQKKLKQQKEYRRQKLSRQKRREYLMRLLTRLRWVVAVTALLLILNLMRISTYEVSNYTGLTAADVTVIEQLTDEYLSGTKRIKTFFDADTYEEYIKQNASFVGDVEASTSFLSTEMTVRVISKEPKHAFRGSENNTNQYIASDGTLISLTDEQLEAIGAREPKTVITDTSGIDYLEGDAIVPEDVLQYMQILEVELGLLDYKVRGYGIAGNTRELTVDMVGKGYDLLVSTTRPIESVLEDFKLAEEKLRKTRTEPKQYIDLRIVDKVYYR